MKKHIIKLNFFITLFFFPHIRASAQNHFYTSIKIPLNEYVWSILEEKKDYLNEQQTTNKDRETEGVSFLASYAKNIKHHLFLEYGIEYLAVNRTITETAHTYLEIENSALSFQTIPTYRSKIAEDDKAFLSLGLGVNLQKIWSKGIYNDFGREIISKQQSVAHQAGNWLINVQPQLVFELLSNDKIGVRFGISYACNNWSKVEKKLYFNNAPNLVPAFHKTSAIFFSGGFVF